MGILQALFPIASVLRRGNGGIPSDAGRLFAGGAAESGVPLDVLTDLVTWHDACGDVLRASPSAILLAGTGPRHLLGDGLLTRVHISDRPVFLKALSDAANGPKPVCAEFRLHRGETSGADPLATGAALPGEVIWVEMRAHRLAEPGGAAVIAFTRDTTEQKQRADELEQARLEAERADKLKGRFLATVSHELRTPLNAIIGFSELLSADHPFLLTEERRKEYGTIIRNSGHHLLDIVNTLLDISKIESGNFAFTPEPFSFSDLARSCCDLMQLRADEAELRIERRLDTVSREIAGDRRACRQIVINLLSNALKFTPAGGSVTVSVGEREDALLLSVADTGIGIAEADLPRLGDPFFQAGQVHGRRYEGTGLGLSVVRGLVGLHGGAMSIESGSGVGTTVTVSLPFEAGATPPEARPVTVRTRPRPLVRPSQRMIA